MKEMKGNCICLCAPHSHLNPPPPGPPKPHWPLNRPRNMMLDEEGDGGNVWIASITLHLKRT